MAANNLSSLNRQLMNKLQSAMVKVQKEAMRDMEEGLDYFYSAGPGKVYIRTGAMGNTPSITPLAVSGNEVSFDAYLDKSYVYGSADMPSMGQVLDLANYGTPWKTAGNRWAHPTVGNSGFWEKSEEMIKQSFEKIMSQTFS